jgi:hypothetical protein
MKLNITPGPWSARRPEDSNGYSYVDGKDSELGRTATCYDGDIYPDNAAAIVTAVNNTYHKGINPEAVPEMLECLKMSVAIFEAMGIKDNSRIVGEQYGKIKSAIQKATL